MRRPRGSTMVELMLGIALLSMLLTMLFVIFHQGWSAWRMAGTRTDLGNQGRLAVQSLTREMEGSIYASLSIQGEAVSFLSARDATGQFALDANGAPEWQRYVLFYRDAPTRRMMRCEVPVPPGMTDPLPIEESTGQPVVSHLSPERLVAERVESFNCTVPADSRRVELAVDVQEPQRNGLPPAILRVISAVTFRNQ